MKMRTTQKNYDKQRCGEKCPLGTVFFFNFWLVRFVFNIVGFAAVTFPNLFTGLWLIIKWFFWLSFFLVSNTRCKDTTTPGCLFYCLSLPVLPAANFGQSPRQNLSRLAGLSVCSKAQKLRSSKYLQPPLAPSSTYRFHFPRRNTDP